MSIASAAGGAQAIYDFWLDLIPRFFGHFGAVMPTAPADGAPGLGFPADQVGRAAAMTQEALHSLARVYVPVLEASGPAGLLELWASALPTFTLPSAVPGDAASAWTAMTPWLAGNPPRASGATSSAKADPLAMIGPWAAMMPFFASAPAEAAGTGGATAAQAMLAPWMAAMAWKPMIGGGEAATTAGLGIQTATMLPLKAMQSSWLDFASRLVGTSPDALATGLDRTFGGLGDALGLGPLRKLQAAYQDLIAATVAQNNARAAYAMLVQGALVSGFDGLLQRLAMMAEAGERVDSVLALLRMWAATTEQAVHGVLQSEAGLAATAALSRAGITHRRKVQHIAGIVADALDMATRSELDEAYREIQNLKREVRSLRPAPASSAAPTAEARTRKTKRKAQ